MEPRRSLAAGNFHQGPRSARVPTQSYSRASPVPIDELDARQLPKRGEQPSHRRCEFDSARPHILGALLDAAVRGLQALPGVRLPSLPRMADFALWATACGATPWPAGTFAHAYDANGKAAFETNPVAVCIRRLMAERTSRAGAASISDLLRVATYLAGDDISKKGADWPKHPGALASRMRRVQTPLRMQGIEICFSRRKRDVPDPRAVVLSRLRIHYR
jgi:hypothetical protein